MLATTACSGSGPGPVDDRRATEARATARLERARLEAGTGSVSGCEEQLGALAALSRARPRDLMAQAEATLRIVGLHARLRATAPGDERLESACAAPLARATWELVLRAHKQAQKAHDSDGAERAVAGALYRAYVDQFPAREHAVEARFNHGELLWVRERWREAAEQYEAVVRTDPRGRFARDAAYAAMLARKNALGNDRGGPARADGGTPQRATIPEPFPMSADEQALLAAFDLYLGVVPDSAQRVKILYQRARMYHEHGLHEQAIPLFAKIVEEHADQELAVYSANLLLDSLARTSTHPDDIRAWVARFRKNPELMKDVEFAAQVRGIDSDRLDLDGRRAYRQKAFAACGRAMTAAADAAPEHARHAERLLDAARCFDAAGDVPAAQAARARLLAAHPDAAKAARPRAVPSP
jgi:TolA-binding protein